MDQICSFYAGEVVTNISKTSLVNTSNEVVIYGTSMGGICALYPFETKEVYHLIIQLILIFLYKRILIFSFNWKWI